MPIISRCRPGLYSGPQCGLRGLSFIKWEGYFYTTADADRSVGREFKTGLTFSDPLIITHALTENSTARAPQETETNAEKE